MFNKIDVQTIKSSAEEKLYDAAISTEDYVQQEFNRAYRELTYKMGEKRAKKYAEEQINLPF